MDIERLKTAAKFSGGAALLVLAAVGISQFKTGHGLAAVATFGDSTLSITSGAAGVQSGASTTISWNADNIPTAVTNSVAFVSNTGELDAPLQTGLPLLTSNDTHGSANVFTMLDGNTYYVTSPGNGFPSIYKWTTSPAGSESSVPFEGTVGSNGYTVFDRSWQLDPGKTVSAIGFYVDRDITETIKIAKRVSAGTYQIVVSQDCPATKGWNFCTLTAPYVVPASGEYDVGLYTYGAYAGLTTDYVARAYYGANAMGTQSGFGEDVSTPVDVIAIYQGETGSAPCWGDGTYCQVPLTQLPSQTINNDYTDPHPEYSKNTKHFTVGGKDYLVTIPYYGYYPALVYQWMPTQQCFGTGTVCNFPLQSTLPTAWDVDVYANQDGATYATFSMYAGNYDYTYKWMTSAPPQEMSADYNNNYGFGGYTSIDRSWQLDPGKTVTSIGFYSLSTQIASVKIVKRTATSTYDVVLSQDCQVYAYSWVDCALTSPYTVPASGEYDVGIYAAGHIGITSTYQSRAYIGGNIGVTTGKTGFSENTSNAPFLRVVYQGASQPVACFGDGTFCGNQYFYLQRFGSNQRSAVAEHFTMDGTDYLAIGKGYSPAIPNAYVYKWTNASLLPSSYGTPIGDMTMWYGLPGAFDGITNNSYGYTAGAPKSQSPGTYVGKSLPTAQTITGAVTYGATSYGYTYSDNTQVTLSLMASNTAPANASAGTVLGSVTFTDSKDEANPRSIPSNDTTTKYKYVWIRVQSAANYYQMIEEIQFFVGSTQGCWGNGMACELPTSPSATSIMFADQTLSLPSASQWPTLDVKDFEYFDIGSSHYLFVTGLTGMYGAEELLVWMPSQQCFGDGTTCGEPFQAFKTSSNYTYFSLKGQHFIYNGEDYLLIGSHYGYYGSASDLFKWIPTKSCFGDGSTCGEPYYQPDSGRGYTYYTTDPEVFSVGSNQYLDMPAYAGSPLGSVYKLGSIPCVGSAAGCNQPFQTLPGETDTAQGFYIGNQLYLVRGSNNSPGSEVYEWMPSQLCFGNGTLCASSTSDVAYQTLPQTDQANYWEMYTAGGNTHGMFSNSGWGYIYGSRDYVWMTSAPQTESGGSAQTMYPNPSLAGYTMFDRSWQLDPGKKVTSIGFIPSAANQVVKVKIAKRSAAGVYDVVVSQSCTAPIAYQWYDCQLAAPYTVPATGEYDVGTYQAGNIIFSYNATYPRAYAGGDISGTGQSMTEITNYVPSLRVVYQGASTPAACLGDGVMCGAAYQHLQNGTAYTSKVFSIGSKTFLAIGLYNTNPLLYLWMDSGTNCGAYGGWGSGSACGAPYQTPKLQSSYGAGPVSMVPYTIDGVSYLTETNPGGYSATWQWMPSQQCFGDGTSTCDTATPIQIGTSAFGYPGLYFNEGGADYFLLISTGKNNLFYGLYKWMSGSTCWGDGSTCNNPVQRIVYNYVGRSDTFVFNGERYFTIGVNNGTSYVYKWTPSGDGCPPGGGLGNGNACNSWGGLENTYTTLPYSMTELTPLSDPQGNVYLAGAGSASTLLYQWLPEDGSGAPACQVTWQSASGSGVLAVGNSGSGISTGPLTEDTTYTLTCNGTGSVSTTVTVIGSGTLTVPSMGTTTMPYTVSWNTTGMPAGSCKVESPVGHTLWTGESGSHATSTTVAGTYAYTLSCFSGAFSTTSSITIAQAVTLPPPSMTLCTSPNVPSGCNLYLSATRVRQGGTANLTWSASGLTPGVSCAITSSPTVAGLPGAWNGTGSTYSGGPVSIGPISQQTVVTLSCTGAGVTQRVQQTVGLIPKVQEI